MTDWWTQPYRGGTMISLPGFPRPVYPPDAPDRPPSADGPDCLAYKRIVSRLGRWPWDPPSWDDSYSNAFAHGRSSNVGESGMAGVQRQAKISPDTGYIGQKTFNLLRSVLIPDGLPHAGQYAMDGPAVNLLEDAWAIFHGSEIDPTIDQIKDALYDFWHDSVVFEPRWHYRQYRPMQCLGREGDDGGYDDCSEHTTVAFYWARLSTGHPVPDPNGNGYNGYGNTDTLWSHNQARLVTGSYEVGDLAIYGTPGDTKHVCMCVVPGSSSTSAWGSMGSESGPKAVALMYRDDLLGVVRPLLVP
jgi:hypothetical protein